VLADEMALCIDEGIGEGSIHAEHDAYVILKVEEISY
jgi:hypothetical protein